MLNARLRVILRELMASETSVTGDYFVTLNHVTKRTIRSDIKELNGYLRKNGASVISKPGKGYMLDVADEGLFRIFLQTWETAKADLQHVIPDSREERTSFIINRLLLSGDYVKLDDLADVLYVSRSTVQNDLKQVKKALSTYDICLQSRPNYGLLAVGDELKIRFCLAEYLFEHELEKWSTSAFFPLDDIPDMDCISAIIHEQIEQAHIVLSDIAINNLLIHIIIACKRVQNGNEVSLPNTDLESIMQQKEYNVAKSIVQETEHIFQIEFPQAEAAYIAIHLLGTKLMTKTNSSNEVVKDIMDAATSHLVHVALSRIESELHLGIQNDKELFIALHLHLKPAINRYKYGMNVRNPMLDDIKKNYPLSFEAGVVAGLAIKEDSGIAINESEVAYLAMHIGAAMERKKLASGPKRCLIVCASGLGTAQLIYYRIKNYFGKNLEVVGTTEYYQLANYNFQDIDFIVSSISIEETLPIPVVEVNAILGEPDLQRVDKMTLMDEETTPGYFRQDLMFLRQTFETKVAVLQFFQDVLQEKGLVEQTLLDAVAEREKVSPTSYGNLVAIPHPIRPISTETFLVVCTLEKPIDWDGKKVQFVCLLSIKKGNQEDLQAMYKLLGNIVESLETVKKLVNAQSAAEFMSFLE